MTETNTDSKTSNAMKSFAVAAMTAIVPASLIGLWVVPKAVSSFAISTEACIVNTIFTAGCALAAGLATHTYADAKIGPRIDESYNKKAVIAGLFTGLAAVGLLTWQLHAGDGEKQSAVPVQPTQAQSLLTPPLYMQPVGPPKLTYPVYMK